MTDERFPATNMFIHDEQSIVWVHCDCYVWPTSMSNIAAGGRCVRCGWPARNLLVSAANEIIHSRNEAFARFTELTGIANPTVPVKE